MHNDKKRPMNMLKQIVSEMQWTEAELKELPIEDGYRMRGLETTRLDTLVDAAFAFVLSILVISQTGVPETYIELVAGIKSIPALAMSFLVLMLFWLTHREWSRRFGIESKITVVISVSLVFALLIYVYPLRLLFESMFNSLSFGFLPVNFTINSSKELRGFFAFYSSGYLVMCLLIGGLQYSALKRAKLLGLSKFEYWDTRTAFIQWIISGLIAIIALIMAITLPINLLTLAGYVYFSVFVVQIIRARIRVNKRLV